MTCGRMQYIYLRKIFLWLTYFFDNLSGIIGPNPVLYQERQIQRQQHNGHQNYLTQAQRVHDPHGRHRFSEVGAHKHRIQPTHFSRAQLGLDCLNIVQEQGRHVDSEGDSCAKHRDQLEIARFYNSRIQEV